MCISIPLKNWASSLSAGGKHIFLIELVPLPPTLYLKRNKTISFNEGN